MVKDLKWVRYLGGVGAILFILFFWFPLILLFFDRSVTISTNIISTNIVIGILIDITSLLMQLIAVKKISDFSKRKEIFLNYLIATILFIPGTAAVFMAKYFLYIIYNLNWPGDLWFLYVPIDPAFYTKANLSLLAAWVCFTIVGYFIWRSFKKIKEVTKVNLFGVAGLLFFLGSLLMVVYVIEESLLLIDWLLLIIGQLLTAISFFTLPKSLPES